MKHKLVNKLRRENKELKRRIRELEAEKQHWTRENISTNLEGLIEHFRKGKR